MVMSLEINKTLFLPAIAIDNLHMMTVNNKISIQITVNLVIPTFCAYYFLFIYAIQYYVILLVNK